MTTHVVCLDGTGQTRPQPNPTNIALFFNAMGGVIVDAGNDSFESTLAVNGPVVQVGKYLSGVGTEGIPLFKLVEQSVGAGIAEQVVRGYTFLSRNYKPGDEIIIIGFSRGAAAARCLAGFVVGQGLLNPANYHPENKNAAYLRGIAAWYRYRAGILKCLTQRAMMSSGRPDCGHLWHPHCGQSSVGFFMIASLCSLLLIEKALELGAADDRARVDLDRLDAAFVDQFVKKCSGDTEILRGFIDGEARLMVGHIAHGGDLMLVTRLGGACLSRDA
jgi:hypothetical protein